MDLLVAARSPRLRAVGLWLTVTTGTAGLLHLAAPPLASAASEPAADFGSLVVQASALGVAVACVALWLTTTQVALAVLRSPGRPWSGRAGPVRALLLAVCGVVALGALPARAAEPPAPAPTPAQLHGLPLPDRSTGGPAAPASGAADTAVVVRPGDSLWAISARRLGPHASAADVASYGRRIHAANRDAIGPDPDLLHPGRQLLLPAT